MSVPSHSSLLIGAGEALRDELAEADFRTPTITTIAATDGQAYGDGDDIRNRLARQVYSPVQWVTTINTLLKDGALGIIECGPGKVLAGLCKRIDRKIPTAFIDSNDSLQKALLL